MVKWWGEVALPAGRERRWRLGPGSTVLRRAPDSWWIRHEGGADPRSEAFEVVDLEASDAWESGGDVNQRLAFEGDVPALEVVPMTPDRPLVLELEHPTLVLSGESVMLWVQVPLWLGLRLPGARETLADFPIWRPSDTFVGKPTAGELCYAGRTHARRQPDPALRRAQRALTRVHVRNASPSPLALTSLSVPVPRLSLYSDAAGWLSLQGIEVTHRGDTPDAEIDPGTGPIDSLGPATLVQGPRRQATGRFRAHVLADIFR